MFSETILLQFGRLMLCILVAAVTLSQADLQFSMYRTTDSIYCGHLQCLANYNEFDTRVLSIAELSIYDVIQVNLRVKLAYVSMFDPNLFVEPGKVNVLNVTGIVSRYHGDLTLSLRDVTECMYGTFTCELDFLNRDIQADVISYSLTPDLPVLENGTCPMLGSQLSKMEAQIQTHSDMVKAELAQVKTHSVSVEAEMVQIRTENRNITVNLNIILNQLAKLETSFNSSNDDLKVNCVKGMSYTCPREKFLLWGTVPALCDADTDGGGWVIIQRRTKGDVDFYRDWATYKKGFGTPDTDFWIGNDNIHNLTSQGYTELRIDMVLKDGGMGVYAHYSSFSVGDEVSKYKLSVSGYNGTVYDYMDYHNGMYFSTFDRKNDIHVSIHCPIDRHSAWWYKNCAYINLNGLWGATDKTGVFWAIHTRHTQLTLTEMKVRSV